MAAAGLSTAAAPISAAAAAVPGVAVAAAAVAVALPLPPAAADTMLSELQPLLLLHAPSHDPLQHSLSALLPLLPLLPVACLLSAKVTLSLVQLLSAAGRELHCNSG